jgi:hypothetical protein
MIPAIPHMVVFSMKLGASKHAPAWLLRAAPGEVPFGMARSRAQVSARLSYYEAKFPSCKQVLARDAARAPPSTGRFQRLRAAYSATGPGT